MLCWFVYTNTHPSFSLSSPPVTLAQDHDWTSCASLQLYVNEHPECYVEDFGEPCSGLYCEVINGNHYIYSVVFIQKCEDPVTVDAYVFDDADVAFYYSYNESETVDYSQDSYTGILERNATHLGFMVGVHVIIG